MAIRARHLLFGAAVTSAMLLPHQAVPQDDGVDLALVLAIDCSFSVDATEFRLQMQGLGQALQDDAVLDAIRRGPRQRIAVTAYQWSDGEFQKIVLPWTVISSAAEASAAGQMLEDMGRNIPEGGTSISLALRFGERQFAFAPSAVRRVIDLSTDGRNNNGPRLAAVRDSVVAQGITINALAIANEFPELAAYAEKQIVGGTGNFVMQASSYDDFGAAMLRKLIKEITGPGMS
jgi:Protein of unknown function (DUF1194)